MTQEIKAVQMVAELMALSARTAPKGRGIDSIVTRIAAGEDLSQLAGQMRAGFVLVDLFEDDYLPEEDVLSRHIKTFVATRARCIGP